MSQSGSGGAAVQPVHSQNGQSLSNQAQNQRSIQNGQTESEGHAESSQKGSNVPDLSNGFENRTMEYERYAQERAQERVQVVGQSGQIGQMAQMSQLPIGFEGQQYNADGSQALQQAGQYSVNQGRRQSGGQPEERHPVPGQLAPLPVDRIQYVSQTSTQTLPVQAQPQFASDYPGEQTQYSQIRSQFEVRSQMYPQGQFNERAGYVSRDVTYRDQQGLYSQPTSNPVFGGQSKYVTVQPQPSQSASPQPPYYSGVMVPQQGYAQYATQPQYPYSQYSQALINPVPYNPHAGIYAQQFGQQSPNPQRFSQDLSQYQNQPIIQPIAQNVTQGMTLPNAERPNRGPKPMVPPRGNSKITQEQGQRKSSSMDVSSIQKPGVLSSAAEMHRSEGAIAIAGQVAPEGTGTERRYLAPINQNPRTRQDGLYVDSNGDPVTREKLTDSMASDCGLYVSRSEHRKSASVDVTSSFQRRNDTITFTFPGDSQEVMVPARKLSNAETKRLETPGIFSSDQRRIDPGMRVSPMTFENRQENRKSISMDRKAEWGNVSPNQRSISQDNRRSDYFEEHRRSPLTLEGKRLEDIRRSPMPFVPIRETSADRAAQKSPSFVNQAFEKTRQELAIWAEQRQRQELERGMLQGQVFSASPRSRNHSEERRDPRIHQPEERKDVRMSQSAFQPMPNISQSTIMEQRRHLRHVSADLTKHMELSRKDFDDQPVTGSVANLAPGPVGTVSSQRASPNLCHQYAAFSEAKLDTKIALTVVTDFGESPGKPIEQVDHIIHSHRKSHNASSSLLTHSKSQADNLHGQLEIQDEKNEKAEVQQVQMQMQNQQSLDIISEKLTQFERQQSDLQAKLQCLQNQNQILDKVAQFQHQQSDLQVRIQALQSSGQNCEKAGQAQRQQTEFPQHHTSGVDSDAHAGTNNQDQSVEKIHQMHQSLHAVTSHPSALQSQAQLTAEKLSPRPQHDIQHDPNPIQIPNMSQMPLPNLAHFERGDASRSSLPYRLCPSEILESASVVNVASVPSVTSVPSVLPPGATFTTGTLKKVPPEKPPRTSLIVQSPEAESNRSQPAIGLKQTPKARPTIFGTVASDLNPKDGNSRRSLPQTPAGGAGTKSLGAGGVLTLGSAAGLVNGASTDHQDIRDATAINTEHALVYRDGNLVSGSLEALVQHMVPTEEYYPDRAYLFAFLLSARLFIKPHELLGEVCALCEHQQNLNGEGGKERLHRFVPRLVQLLAEWTETFPYDFRDERVMGHVRAITQKVAAVDAAARQEVSALLQSLLLRLTALERYEEGLARLATEAAAEQLTQVDVTELCPSATVLAQQLTHVELERLSYIGPEEFVQAFAKESPHLETSFKDMKKTRNLESYVQWFNRLSYFVATEVCKWSKVQSAKFSILEHQMDPSSNFSSYRSTLKAAMWRSAGATDERQRIVVPFFSLLVKDLYFLNEGCSNKLPNGHINFEKFWQLAKQVTEFIAWKQVACPFEKNPRVIAFLQASPVLTENALALASFECEPPDNNPEKERYKSLKSELNAQ
ncbi:uncharacterized protein LOC107265304 isoform X2 [Cephus cinctus]|uniref:Uncharacterized protein LOC107265304 isoform X2 n=1 Tax=Cephus cinctus TaxID=211228 RepID=A0AAJ7VYL0_CEPCN|nr:uncharacterized protein LOC107265304 isoform X2 [Cephus cinctus]